MSSNFFGGAQFCTDDDGYLAYVNGKSAGRVGHCRAHGCHRFTGIEWEPDKEDICILHFESCPYTRWHDKFRHYARMTKPTRHTNMPFEFYVDSISAHREAEHALSTGATAEETDARLRAFWRKRKRRHYSAFAESFYTIRHLGLDAAAVAGRPKRLRSAAAAATSASLCSRPPVLLPAPP